MLLGKYIYFYVLASVICIWQGEIKKEKGQVRECTEADRLSSVNLES